MKNTFKFFVSRAKAFRKGPSQMHFPGLKPKRRTFKAKVNFQGDARGIAIASSGIGAGAVGVGEGIRRARKTNNKRRRNNGK